MLKSRVKYMKRDLIGFTHLLHENVPKTTYFTCDFPMRSTCVFSVKWANLRTRLRQI